MVKKDYNIFTLFLHYKQIRIIFDGFLYNKIESMGKAVILTAATMFDALSVTVAATLIVIHHSSVTF